MWLLLNNIVVDIFVVFIHISGYPNMYNKIGVTVCNIEITAFY